MTSLFLTLRFLWANRVAVLCALILGLLLIIYLMFGQIGVLRAALAAKPTVEIKTETRIKTVRVAGPVQIREKIVERPGGAHRAVDAVAPRSGREVLRMR